LIPRFLYPVILLAALVTSVAAQSVEELNKRLKKAEEEIAYIDGLLKKNSTRQKTLFQQVELAQKKIKSRKQMIADMEAQIHLLENDLGKKQEDVAGLQSHLEALKQSYEQLLYQAYKNRDQRLWLMYVLSSDDVGLAYRRAQYFKNYAEYINAQASKIKETSQKLHTEIDVLNTQKEALATQRRAREQEMTTLQKEETEALKMTKNLAGQEKEYTHRMADRRRTIENINKQIQKIVRDQTKKDQQRRKETPNLPEADRALSAHFENNRGQLPWPVSKGVITGRFGQHFHSVYKNLKLPPNNGIDILTDENSSVLCVFEGVVRQVFMMPGMNNCVMVQHGGYYTLYCKLSGVKVRAGDKVTRGQALGTIFTTEEAVLHFELWEMRDKGDPENLNPELWLKK